jgi:hypothetical protein
MKTGRVFWGMVFLTIGVVLMLERFHVVSVSWLPLWKFWPLILVFWGIAILVAHNIARWVAAGVAGLFLGLLVAGMIGYAVFDETEDVRAGEGIVQEFSESIDSTVTMASFQLDAGAGTFTVLSSPERRVTATTHSSVGTYRVLRDSLADGPAIRMELRGRGHGWWHRRFSNSADVRLSSRPAWDLSFHVGASRLDLDLADLAVRSLRLDAGATNAKVTLGGGPEEMNVSVKAGASLIRILVPESVGCDVRIDTPMGEKSLNEFEKIGKGHYQTGNFSEATRKILITIDAGVSSVKVMRY